MESHKDKTTAIRTQDPHWLKYYNLKPKKPMKPIDMLFKSIGKKTIQEHIQDKTCSCCYKVVQMSKMTEEDIIELGISGMCKTCQDDFFKN
tara:strand:+ start:58 stop:330 length:273 start_codon:yes stop_codon:yes gene_type:complete